MYQLHEIFLTYCKHYENISFYLTMSPEKEQKIIENIKSSCYSLYMFLFQCDKEKKICVRLAICIVCVRKKCTINFAIQMETTIVNDSSQSSKLFSPIIVVFGILNYFLDGNE